MTTRTVKVQRPVFPPDGDWLVYDQLREHEDHFQPDQWMRETVGARMVTWWRATWSADGWIFKQRLKQNFNWD